MIKVVWTDNGYDYDITDGEAVKDDGLSTMVIYLLFTDARASDDDELPGGTTDKKGWPGDTYSEFNWGSRLWLLKRKKLTNAIVGTVKDYASEALAPLVTYRYASSYSVSATRSSRYTIDLEIEITKPDSTTASYQAQLRWEAQANV